MHRSGSQSCCLTLQLDYSRISNPPNSSWADKCQQRPRETPKRVHCQQTAEEEDGRGFVLIGRSDWARDWPPLRHWLLAVSLRICCRRFPRHSACTRQARQACIRLETVWSLSEIDKFEDGSFLACLCWFARKLPAENGNSCSPPQTPSRTSRHAQPEIYIFIYFSQINAVKVFFLLQSISKQLFMHRQGTRPSAPGVQEESTIQKAASTSTKKSALSL
ncbi:uncharacterized protein LOC124849764 [Scophthalmus maximus]|uniref:uncharacterized protein LOC124849764 n=1 Tax=Scophthalmus maximus TaxID=52904 RepID=UPI001FA90472|nr:uncharacterized protein LOC124849764 [Scophthalmus maximus]